MCESVIQVTIIKTLCDKFLVIHSPTLINDDLFYYLMRKTTLYLNQLLLINWKVVLSATQVSNSIPVPSQY